MMSLGTDDLLERSSVFWTFNHLSGTNHASRENSIFNPRMILKFCIRNQCETAEPIRLIYVDVTQILSKGT